MEEIRIVRISLPGIPQSTNHLYKVHCRKKIRGKIIPTVYMTKEGAQMKETYSLLARCQMSGKRFTEGVKIYVHLYFGTKHTHDIDNYNKILLDSLKGIVWNDDVQISTMYIQKYYDKENPRIEISVTETGLPIIK